MPRRWCAGRGVAGGHVGGVESRNDVGEFWKGVCLREETHCFVDENGGKGVWKVGRILF